MGDGDSCFNENINGNDFRIWCKCGCVEKYKGRICLNTLHDEGVYTRIQDKDSYIYEGSFYANDFEGYARVVAEDSTYFEGLFKSNKRFGPGVLTYKDGTQDVGMWIGFDLIRLSRVVQPEWVPRLACSDLGKAKLLKYRKVVPIERESGRSKGVEILNIINSRSSNRAFNYSSDEIKVEDVLCEKLFNKHVRNRNSLCFDKTYFDEHYFRDLDYYIDVVSDEDILTAEQSNPSQDDLSDKEIMIEDILEQIKTIEDKCERHLIMQKFDVLRKILHYQKNPELRLNNIHTQRIRVTHLMAWNNMELLIEILQHTFLHRKREIFVNFDVEALIRAKRDLFSDIGERELACVHFLNNCSRGDLKALKRITPRCNPDVSDAKGNTGMMYAAARDKTHVIKYLAEIGANMDYKNDEGLTPLNMCLLRYLSELNGVINWEKAFLLDKNEEMREDYQVWRQRASLACLAIHACLSNLENSSEYKKLLILCSNETSNWFTDDMCLLYNHLKLEKPDDSLQNFQKPYEYDPEAHQDYIFKTNFSKDNKKIKSIKNKNSNVVFNTISVLLHCGSDPNLANVPLPALFIGLFIGDDLIYKRLLDYKADVNVIHGEDKLTPLHLITTLPLNEHHASLCKMLLNYGADANMRCSESHWPEQKLKIIGNFDGDIVDEGKTPLHILAMREDFSSKNIRYFNEIACILKTYASSSLTYLGHNPLSLSVLKGNVGLVETFLKSGDDPNTILGNNLGTALTIYTLKRYTKTLPPLKICKRILDLLIYHGGNILGSIGEYRNVIEFMMNETVKGKHLKSLAIFNYMKQLMKTELLKYYKTKALLFILGNISENDDDYVCKNLAKFLTPHEALIRIHFLVVKKILNSLSIIENVFDYIIHNGTGKHKETVDVIMSRLKHYKGDETFGFDQNEDDYVVCFTCGLKTNKLLLVCPKCKLVYFCSKVCNKAAASGKSGHPCRNVFYGDEFMSYKNCLLLGIPWVVHNLGGVQDLVNAFKEVKFDLVESKGNKFVKINSNFDVITVKTQGGNNRLISEDRKSKERAYLDKETNKRLISKDRKSKERAYLDKEKNNHLIISKDRKSKDKERFLNANTKDGRIKSTNGSHAKRAHRGKDSNLSDYYNSKNGTKGSNKKATKCDQVRHVNTTPHNKVMMKSGIKANARKDGVIINKNTLVTDASKILETDTNISINKDNSGEINRISGQHINVLSQLLSLHPNLNVLGLFKPFVCFREGELYYKFPLSNQNTYFCSTYTST